MRIFQPTELLIHTVALGEKSGITYRQYWAFRHGGNPYPEKVLETVSIGRRVGETFPLKYPLLPVRLPRVRGMGKREL